MEDGVQLGVHQSLVVRVSIKAHQTVNLHLPTPRVGTPTAVDGGVSPGSSSTIVHAEGEALVVVDGRDAFVLEGRGEVSVDAERWAEGRVESWAV